jgi:hypothetical protein
MRRPRTAWIEPIAASVGAQVLVSDDADGFKSAADELGLLHQVGTSHVKRNTQALIQDLGPLVAKDSDGSLTAIGVASTQAVADLDRLAELISSRRPEQGSELEGMHHRDLSAVPPKKGAVASLAYRLRLLYLDRWNRWSRLTRYRKWHANHSDQEQLDGTNKACERAIGWWIKERYRSMRGDIGPSQCHTGQSPSCLVWQLSHPGWGEPGNGAWLSGHKQVDHTAVPSHSLLHHSLNAHCF